MPVLQLLLLSILQDPAARPAPPAVARLTHVVHAYASFSPDGGTLVFQSNATGDWDLYAMRADGSGLRPLVTSPGADITPVFSPDGKTIVFVSERDGQREVYLCDPAGGDQRRVTRDPGHDLHPVWSRDGGRILFSSNRGNASTDDYDLYSMRPDGADLVQLTRGPDVDTYASWSPDGAHIVTRRVLAGTDDNEVFLLDADGGNPRNLTNDPGSYDGWPVWSPDGRRIAFAGGPPGGSPHRIQVMDADGGNRSALTGAAAPGGFVYDTQPCFSPDGRRLAFTRYAPTARESAEICVLELSKPG
jgi:TolB protein